MDEQKPGEVVTPGQAQPTPQPNTGLQGATPQAPDQPIQPAQPPVVMTEPSPQPEPEVVTVDQSQQQTYGQAETPAEAATQTGQPSDEGLLRWQTTEGGTGHEKSGSLFLLIVVACVVLAGGVYFLTHDFVSVAAIFIGVIALLYLTARRPGVQDYALSESGVYVGRKLYDYDNYKGFSVNEDHGQTIIMFIPLKRFMPPLIIHVEPQMATTVVEALSTVLPHDDRKPDAVDSLMRRMRF